MVVFWTVTLKGKFSWILNSIIFLDYEEKLIPCHAFYTNLSLVPPVIWGTRRQIHGNHRPQKVPEYRDMSRLVLHFYLCAGSWRFITLKAKQQPPCASVPLTPMSMTSFFSSSLPAPCPGSSAFQLQPFISGRIWQFSPEYTLSSRLLLGSVVLRNNE